MSASHSQTYAAVIVSRSGLLLEGFARLLENTAFQVVAMAADLEQLALPDPPQHGGLILIVDGRELKTALSQVRSFRAQRESCQVAVILGELRSTDVLSFFEAGAHVCLPESVAAETFLKSLELIMLRETLISTAMPVFAPLTATPKKPELTTVATARLLSVQEEQIVRGIVQGHSNKVIARSLGIADATVKVHVKSILRKLRVNNRTQAAIWGVQHGLGDQRAFTPASKATLNGSAPQKRAPADPVG